MAMPFDTLKLSRRLEAAGFAPQQAGYMAEAIAEAVAPLATRPICKRRSAGWVPN
jgi:hypothetical protein